MTRNLFTSPELEHARRRGAGKQLVTYGVLAAGAGVVGIVLSSILKAVWLGILGGPLGALSWLALLGGAGLAWWGYSMIRSSRDRG